MLDDYQKEYISSSCMYIIVLINDPCSALENHNLEKDDNGIQVVTNKI